MRRKSTRAARRRRAVQSTLLVAALAQAPAVAAGPGEAPSLLGAWDGTVIPEGGQPRAARLMVTKQLKGRFGGDLCVAAQPETRCGPVRGRVGKGGHVQVRVRIAETAAGQGVLEGTTLSLSSPQEWFAECYLVKVEP